MLMAGRKGKRNGAICWKGRKEKAGIEDSVRLWSMVWYARVCNGVLVCKLGSRNQWRQRQASLRELLPRQGSLCSPCRVPAWLGDKGRDGGGGGCGSANVTERGEEGKIEKKVRG